MQARPLIIQDTFLELRFEEGDAPSQPAISETLRPSTDAAMLSSALK
jgi:hypothetical protein